MQAAAVDILVQKGKFDAQVAMAVAEAIAMEMNSSQLVTVPILDARFASFEAKMDVRFAKVDARFEVQEARFDSKLQKLKSELVVAQQEIKTQLLDRQESMKTELLHGQQKMQTHLFFWIVAVVMGSDYLPKVLTLLGEAIRAFQEAF